MSVSGVRVIGGEVRREKYCYKPFLFLFFLSCYYSLDICFLSSSPHNEVTIASAIEENGVIDVSNTNTKKTTSKSCVLQLHMIIFLEFLSGIFKVVLGFFVFSIMVALTVHMEQQYCMC